MQILSAILLTYRFFFLYNPTIDITNNKAVKVPMIPIDGNGFVGVVEDVDGGTHMLSNSSTKWLFGPTSLSAAR